jgi:hypothetical protein
VPEGKGGLFTSLIDVFLMETALFVEWDFAEAFDFWRCLELTNHIALHLPFFGFFQ